MDSIREMLAEMLLLEFTWVTYLLVVYSIADSLWIQRLLRKVLLILNTGTSITMRRDRQLQGLGYCLGRVEAWMIRITGLIHLFCSLVCWIFIIIAGSAGCRHIYARSFDHLMVFVVIIRAGYLFVVQGTLVTQRWGCQVDLRCRLLKRHMSWLSLGWFFRATT